MVGNSSHKIFEKSERIIKCLFDDSVTSGGGIGRRGGLVPLGETDCAGSSPALMPGRQCPREGRSKACDDILGRGGHELNARKRELNNGYLPWRIIVA